jgi:general secretion pathway protein K
MVGKHRAHTALLADDSGMALLMTLAAISFLVAITVGLAVSVNWQLQASASLKQSVLLDEALLSGLDLARAVLYEDQVKENFDTALDSWNDWDEEKLAELLPGSGLAITIRDLSGLLPVNRLVFQSGQGQDRKTPPQARQPGRNPGREAALQRRLWLRFLLSGKFAVADADEAASLVDALADWLDEDDQERDHGAENGYYQGLKNPYACANGPLLYPEELLLIKGFSRKIVYGDEEHEGIIDYLTIYSHVGKININTSPVPVLQALAPNMTSELAGELISFREEKKNRDLLQNPAWYRQVPDFPGDITFESSLVTTRSSFFQVQVNAQQAGLRRTGTGVVYRDPATRQQELKSWQIE